MNIVYHGILEEILSFDKTSMSLVYLPSETEDSDKGDNFNNFAAVTSIIL